MSAEQKFDPGVYRYDAAAYVKYLLAARERAEPGFVTAEMHQKWHLKEDFPGVLNVYQLLTYAKKKISAIDVSYSEPGGSSGLGDVEEGSVGDLQVEISFLVDGEALDVAVSTAKNGQPIDWDNLVQWDKLDAIRDGLNLLPHPPDQPAKSERVQLFRQNHDPVALIDGKPASPLSEAEYNVVQTLLEAEGNSLTNAELSKRSGHTDARKFLERLAKKQD